MNVTDEKEGKEITVGVNDILNSNGSPTLLFKNSVQLGDPGRRRATIPLKHVK